MLYFPRGGSDEELLATLHFFQRGGEDCPLHTLTLFEHPGVSSRTINYVLENLSAPAFRRLTSLTIDSVFYPALRNLSNLAALHFELRIPQFKIEPWVSYPQVPWCLPTSGSLKRLEVSIQATWSSYLPLLPTSLGEEARNLRTIVYSGQPRFNDGLDKLCPQLEELEITHNAGDAYARPVTLSIPKSLTRLKQSDIYSAFYPLPSLERYPHLTDLTFMWNERKDTLVSLDHLLRAPHLKNLKIMGVNNFLEDEVFYTQFATLPPELKPNLARLDIQALPASLETIEMLKQAFPSAEILYTLIDPRLNHTPEDIGDNSQIPINVSYLAPVQLGDLIQCPRCEMSVEELSPEDHHVVCEKSIRKCRLASFGCLFEGTKSETRQHVPYCDYYLVECYYCRQSLPVSQYQGHMLLHLRAYSIVQGPYLRLPHAQTPTFREVLCHACKMPFPSLEEAQNHECSQSTRRVPLPEANESTIFKRLSMISYPDVEPFDPR